MRRFYLYRKEDPTGMSGTGRVADGIEFANGQVAMTWKKEYPSVTIFPSVSIVEKLHTHNGKDPTKIVWIDDITEDLEAKSEKLKTAKLEELQREVEETVAAAAVADVEIEETDEEDIEEEETD